MRGMPAQVVFKGRENFERGEKKKHPSSPSRGLRCFQPATGRVNVSVWACVRTFFISEDHIAVLMAVQPPRSASKHPRSGWQMARCSTASGGHHLLECPPAQVANVAKEGLKKKKNIFSIFVQYYCDELISWRSC